MLQRLNFFLLLCIYSSITLGMDFPVGVGHLEAAARGHKRKNEEPDPFGDRRLKIASEEDKVHRDIKKFFDIRSKIASRDIKNHIFSFVMLEEWHHHVNQSIAPTRISLSDDGNLFTINFSDREEIYNRRSGGVIRRPSDGMSIIKKCDKHDVTKVNEKLVILKNLNKSGQLKLTSLGIIEYAAHAPKSHTTAIVYCPKSEITPWPRKVFITEDPEHFFNALDRGLAKVRAKRAAHSLHVP